MSGGLLGFKYEGTGQLQIASAIESVEKYIISNSISLKSNQ